MKTSLEGEAVGLYVQQKNIGLNEKFGYLHIPLQDTAINPGFCWLFVICLVIDTFNGLH